jgi:predicted kinase
MNYQETAELFLESFKGTLLWENMESETEGTRWHGEENVAVHTQMVLDEYCMDIMEEWTKQDLLGYLACLFHDVGKPDSKRVVEKEGKPHNTYKRHEALSARLWEDFIVSQPLLAANIGLTQIDIFTVAWMVQSHLVFNIVKPLKVAMIKKTCEKLEIVKQFIRMVMSDTKGRITDNMPEKVKFTHDWFVNFNKLDVSQYKTPGEFQGKVLYMPIGAPGSGKTTLFSQVDAANEHAEMVVFSYDNIRKEVNGSYKESDVKPGFYEMANKRFFKMAAKHCSIYVDNMNLSKKRRGWVLSHAKSKGFHTVAIIKLITISDCMKNNKSRCIDKVVPDEILIEKYINLNYPSFIEFDEIMVI